MDKVAVYSVLHIMAVKKKLIRKKSSKKSRQGESARKIQWLMKAKDPSIYVDRSVKSGLTPGEKMRATRQWLSLNGFSIKDIEYARNRHPYWKSVKRKNHNERTKRRFDEFNFSNGNSRRWTSRELGDFLKMTDSTSDRELARHFERSIPSIQGIRRRLNLGRRILLARGTRKIRKESLVKFLITDEEKLRRMLKEAQGV